MKKNVAIIILILIGVLTSVQAQARTFVLATVHDVVLDEARLIVEEAYKRLGFDVEIRELPGERALQLAINGAVDAELARIYDVGEKHTSLLRVEIPVQTIEGVVFVKDTNLTVDGWQSLAPYRIGLQIGIKFAEAGTRGMNVMKFAENDKLFELLDLGRLDLVVHLRRTGEHILDSLGFDDIRAVGPPVYTGKLYHYVNKKNAFLVSRLESALRDMEADGTMARLRLEASK